MANRIFFITNSNVKQWSELLIDYGAEYWEAYRAILQWHARLARERALLRSERKLTEIEQQLREERRRRQLSSPIPQHSQNAQRVRLFRLKNSQL